MEPEKRSIGPVIAVVTGAQAGATVAVLAKMRTADSPPDREWVSNGPYLPKISDEAFRQRIGDMTAVGSLLSVVEEAAKGSEQAKFLLAGMKSMPEFIKYDPVNGTCDFVSDPFEATGVTVNREAMEELLLLERDQERQKMFNRRFMGDGASTTFPFYTGNEPTKMHCPTTTQRKKEKREAKKPVKAGQNYLRIGKR